MQIVQARIGRQTIALAVDTDVVEVKNRIVEAARDGAGFVDFETPGGRLLSVLITQAIPVRFETFDVIDDGSEPEQDASPIERFDTLGYADFES
jgi:hypothetical protein